MTAVVQPAETITVTREKLKKALEEVLDSGYWEDASDAWVVRGADDLDEFANAVFDEAKDRGE